MRNKAAMALCDRLGTPLCKEPCEICLEEAEAVFQSIGLNDHTKISPIVNLKEVKK